MSVTPAVMRRLMRELVELKNSPPEGIRVLTSEANMLDVTGIIEGPESTPYAGGYFHVKFKFTDEFPAAPPKCWLATKIFHPNVSTSGEICVNTLKKDWKSTYGIGHILVTVKCLLIYPNPESALDEEAGKLLLENYDDYCSRAKLITSIHATPRTRPVEFDSVPSTSNSNAAPTITAANLPLTSLSIPSTSTSPSTIASTRKSPAPPSQPLQSSPANTLPTATSASSLSGDKDNKERRASPAPLGTANANLDKSSIGMGPAPMPTTKAVKRSATSSGPTGMEKRKKALKRL